MQEYELHLSKWLTKSSNKIEQGAHGMKHLSNMSNSNMSSRQAVFHELTMRQDCCTEMPTLKLSVQGAHNALVLLWTVASLCSRAIQCTDDAACNLVRFRFAVRTC